MFGLCVDANVISRGCFSIGIVGAFVFEFANKPPIVYWRGRAVRKRKILCMFSVAAECIFRLGIFQWTVLHGSKVRLHFIRHTANAGHCI